MRSVLLESAYKRITKGFTIVRHDWMLSTLENVRLREGDRVVVSLGSGVHQVEVIDSSDQSKLRIRLDSGVELWIGRRAILSVQEQGNG